MAEPLSVLVTLAAFLVPPGDGAFAADSSRAPACVQVANHASPASGLALKYPSRLDVLRDLAERPQAEWGPCRHRAASHAPGARKSRSVWRGA
jgi:hypothetical protein